MPHIDLGSQNYCYCLHILHRRTIDTCPEFWRNKIWERFLDKCQNLSSGSKYLEEKEKKKHLKPSLEFFRILLQCANFFKFSSFIQPSSNELRTCLDKFKKQIMTNFLLRMVKIFHNCFCQILDHFKSDGFIFLLCTL